MKKLSFMLLSLLAVVMLTACGNDDEPVNRQTVNMAINSRMIDASDGTVVFSQNTAKVEINYTDMTISFNCNYKDLNGQSQAYSSPVMDLRQQKGSVYRIEPHSAVDASGFLDMATGMMWYRVGSLDDGVALVMTTQLLYAYSTTTITNPENGNHGAHEQSAYLFVLDPSGETCEMKISNFTSNLNGAIDVPEVDYEGLTVTPNGTGYKITASEIESNYNGYYKLTDVDFTLNDQCMVIGGSFKCNGLEFNITGPLFPLN